jgi:hypothetical protein
MCQRMQASGDDDWEEDADKREEVLFPAPSPYRGYSKLRTRTDVGAYGRAMPRSIGPP